MSTLLIDNPQGEHEGNEQQNRKEAVIVLSNDSLNQVANNFSDSFHLLHLVL